MEVVAPAGDLASLKSAVAAGADAVYFGITLPGLTRTGLRPDQYALTLSSAAQGLEFCHAQGRKGYLVLNNYYRDHHLALLKDQIDSILEINPDAIIVSDPALMEHLHERAPRLPLHASVLNAICNVPAARLLLRWGVKRIIPERIVTLKDLAAIREATGLDLEVFAYGGFCYSFHSNCHLSRYLFGPMCLAPCMNNWRLAGGNGPAARRAWLRSRFLDVRPILGELARAGVKGLKIEGRQKGLHYVEMAVQAMREAVDALGAGGERKAGRGAEAPYPRSLTHSGFYAQADLGAESMLPDISAGQHWDMVRPYLTPRGIKWLARRFWEKRSEP